LVAFQHGRLGTLVSDTFSIEAASVEECKFAPLSTGLWFGIFASCAATIARWLSFKCLRLRFKQLA